MRVPGAVTGKSHVFATFDRRIATSSSAPRPFPPVKCETGPGGRSTEHKGETIVEFTSKSRLIVSDIIAYVVLTFAIGLAVSLTLAGAVLLLAGQPA